METIGYKGVPDRRGEGEKWSDPDDVEAIALRGLQGVGGHGLEHTPSALAPDSQDTVEFEFPTELNFARHAAPEMPTSDNTSLRPALGSPDYPYLQGHA